MSVETDKQQRWNQRYQEKTESKQTPAFVLQSNQSLLSQKGKALDLACGLGGNSLFLARQGYQVTAVDYANSALEKLASKSSENNLSIETLLCDLEKDELNLTGLDVIVVSYYLQRSLFPLIFSLLKPGGLLFYQTFSGEQVQGVGPQNPTFRLKQGELLSLCQQQTVLFYREDPFDCVGGECLCGESMIVVRKK